MVSLQDHAYTYHECICACALMSKMSRRILVYTDGGEGASEACVAMAIRELRRVLSWLVRRDTLQEGGEREYTVEKTDAAAIRGGVLQEHCRLLVIPGGRDLPYCAKLDGTGNKNIREFVRLGGSYLGLCAGGYYGASYVQFAAGDPVLEVVGPRELKFYPGVARGPTFGGFRYESNAGARVCSLSLQPATTKLLEKSCPMEDTHPLFVFYNGGGHFSDMMTSEQTHRGHLHSEEEVVVTTNIQVLATYNRSSGGADSQWDGPIHDSTDAISQSDDPLPDGLTPDNPAALVSMQYGAGKVVLTGVHPEASETTLSEAYSGDKYIEALANKLRTSESIRAALFNALVTYLLS